MAIRPKKQLDLWTGVTNMVEKLITGGYLAQLILLIVVWGSIAYLAVFQHPIPDPLLDAGFIILGSYFHTLATQVSNRPNGNSTPDN